jgi:hypothetical protein
MTNEMLTLPWNNDLLTEQEFKAWVASRKDAAKTIDIAACELGMWYVFDADPYGDPDGVRDRCGELLEGTQQDEMKEVMKQVRTNHFVRGPQSDGWVSEDDLSEQQVKAMYDRIHQMLAWVGSRKQAAKLIDPETCEITCWIVHHADPYGVREDLHPCDDYHETFNFVAGPGTDGWVCESDLSLDQFAVLQDRIERESEARRQAKEDAIARRDIEAVKTHFFDGYFKDDAEVGEMCDRWNRRHTSAAGKS